MRKYFCDSCGEEVDKPNVIKIPCHLYSGGVGIGRMGIGEMDSIDLCNKCQNIAYSAFVNSLCRLNSSSSEGSSSAGCSPTTPSLDVPFTELGQTVETLEAWYNRRVASKEHCCKQACTKDEGHAHGLCNSHGLSSLKEEWNYD